MPSKIQRFTVSYYDEDRAHDVVPIGQYEAAKAEEKYGDGALSERGVISALAYAAFLGAQRVGGIVPDGMTFEKWHYTVAAVEPLEGDSGESRAPLGT